MAVRKKVPPIPRLSVTGKDTAMPSRNVQISIIPAIDFSATPVRVEATVRGPGGAAVVIGSATPDENGRCALTYDPATVVDPHVYPRPRVRLRVMAGDRSLPLADGGPDWPLDDPPPAVEVSVQADEAHDSVTVPAPPPDEADGELDGKVAGTIRHTDGTPIAGVMVQAVTPTIIGEDVLASAATADNGTYQFPWNPVTSPCLFVRVVGEDGRVVAASPPVDGAASGWVDVYVRDERFRGPSDFQRVHQAVAPLIEGRDLAVLNGRSVGFVVRRTGLHRKQITPYLVARRQAEATGIDAEALYGLIRSGGTRAVGRLLNAGQASIIRRLESAGAANIVSLAVSTSGAAVYRQLRGNLAREAAGGTAPDAFGSLLRTTSLGEPQRSALVTVHLARPRETRAMWAQLRADPDFGDTAVDDVQFSLHLGVLTGNHVPLVSALREDRRVGRARDLVAFTKADWLTHIRGTHDGRPVGVPASFRAAAAADREDAYTQRLMHNVERAWPTAFVAAQMHSDDFAGKDLLLAFLAANEDFDFGRTTAHTRIASTGAVRPEGQTEELLAVVARHQRLFRISPVTDRWGSMRALDTAGLRSARDVARLGKRAFIARFAGDVGGDIRARTIYETAAVQTARAVNLVANFGAAYQGPSVLALPPVGAAVAELEPVNGLPDWRTLFGGIDFCACEHCRSVLSPAAYLTDLLHWLEDEGALEPLLHRRPDLFAMKLSCENTNTVVPYVDLVIEVLENRVAGIASLPAIAHTASTLPSDVLLAHPEYLNQAVYDEVLARAGYPFDLPFDLTALQGRVYLEQQGVRRPDLMRAFQRGAVPSDVAIAAEHLRLTTAERRLVTGPAGRPQPELWGYPAGDPSWTTALAGASEFLDRSGLSFPELLDLLHVSWVNPDWTLGLASPEGESNCDLAQMRLQDATQADPDAAVYDRARRFVRLWRKLDWSIIDLDKVLIALGAAEIDNAVIESISNIRRIRDAVRIDLLALLSLWSDVDMKVDRPARDTAIIPLYDRVFLDRAVITDESSWPFRLDADRNLVSAGDTLSTWTVELQAALGVTAEELDEILEPDMALSIPTLSQLYRTVALARALKIAVGDLLAYRDLFAQLDLASDPFADDSGGFDTGATLRFIEEVQAVQSAGFTADDLLYLLGHDADAAVSVGPDETAQAAFLVELQVGLRSVEAEAIVEPDPTGEITQQLLCEIVDAADLDAVLALIDGFPPVDPAEEERLHATYLALFITDVDPRGVAWAAMPAAERYAFVLARLVPYLATVRKERLVRQKVASLLGLAQDQSDALLALAPASVLDDPVADGAADLLGVLLSRGLIDAEILATTGDHTAAFATLTLLDKIATLFGKLSIGSEEQAWLLSAGVSTGMLDPAALPLASTMDAAALYPRWGALREALRVRDVLPGSTPTVIELFTTANDPIATRDDLLGQVRDRTGWSFETDATVYSDLRWLADEFGFVDPAAFRDGTALHALAECFAVLRNVGVTAQEAGAWGAADVTPAVAGAVTLAAKSDYEPARWYEVARPLRNKLREQQRAALVSWLVQNTPGHSDAGDLFADVLVDVEMDACTLTSRIVQATGSVQLYVQRCFLNLETPDLGPGADERWAWMRNYRVWEANRRVFLYPENWLWPELRDDKSEIFEALETELLQAPITDATSELAYVNYLESLLQVSRLQIVAYYHEQDEDAEAAVDVLHVFGRTPNLPRQYFYRRREAGIWSPWEKMDIDIEGDHLIPVVHNRRLMLFWPIFLEQAINNTSGVTPAKYVTVQLAHSEKRGPAWAPKQVSEQELSTQSAQTGSSPPSWLYGFHFRPSHTDSGSLEIQCVYSRYHYEAWSCGRFVFDDCTGAVQAMPEAALDSLVYPSFTMASYSRLSIVNEFDWNTDEGAWDLSLRAWFPVGPVDSDKDLLADESAESVLALETCVPNTVYTIPRQYNEFASQDPFFYFDDERTFLVEPAQGLAPSDYTHQFDTDEIAPDAPGKAEPGAAYDGLEVGDDRDQAGGVLWFDRSIDAVAVPDGKVGALPAAKEAGTSAPVTNLAPADATETFGISIGASASQKSLAGDPFAQTAEGMQQAAAFADAVAYDGFATQEEDRGLQTFGQVATGVLGDPVWTYTFSPHYHPYACQFIAEVRRNGIDGLLSPADEDSPTAANTLARQQLADLQVFEETYQPVDSVVIEPYPVENIQFGGPGAYSLYNWELFFHIPLLIAERLRREGRFDEALRWFHFIFDPTNRNPAYEAPYRYWKVRPFTSSIGETIQELLAVLSSDDASTEAVELRADVEAQIAAYIADPFNPWAIARLRITAYQKTVVIKYVRTLLEWADSLFRQDSMESLNEATQIYLMAREILGDRPEDIPAREDVVAKSWNELKDEGLDAFSNTVVEVENLLFAPRPVSGAEPPAINLGTTLYFCVPHNEDLISLWDTVDDRLYKIRHCMNIEGVVRQLPLFQPRIDPGALVSAAAAGVSLSSAVAGLQVALPHYRFRVMVQKAQALAANVRSLGGALLAALEKRDAEALQQLRTSQEIALLDAVRDVRVQQVQEAKASLAALERSRQVAQARAQHYHGLVEDGLSELENQQINKLKAANTAALAHQSARALAATLHLIPDADAGASGMASPVVKFQFGGANLGFSATGAADLLGVVATFYSQKAAMHGLEAGNARREQEWQLQADLADKDTEAISQQIEAAQARQQITERELSNHDLQREHARTVDQWMRGKYTSDQLYDWMAAQISAVHYQSYALAYDVARQAERCYQHELARSDASFVQFASWDSLRKGLLAGERLGLDLDRMEVSYLQNDKRELELTRNVSLASIDPLALVALRETGSCTFKLDEVLFDLDVPGLYLRRIKSVSLTVPAVVGPLAGLHTKLTLTKSSTRLTPTVESPDDPGAGYRRTADEDLRFRDEVGAVESIVTSTGRNDAGLFQPDHDDPRYLPFERRGVISDWQLSLEGVFDAFDRRTIPDVVLHVRYTARDGGDVLKSGATASIGDALAARATGLTDATGPLALFSARHDFPDAWNAFLYPAEAETDQSLAVALDIDRFPYAVRGQEIAIDRLIVFLLPASGIAWSDTEPLGLTLVPAAGDGAAQELKTAGSLAEGVPMAVFDYGTAAQPPGAFTLNASLAAIAAVEEAFRTGDKLNADAIDDLLIVVHYSVTPTAT